MADTKLINVFQWKKGIHPGFNAMITQEEAKRAWALPKGFWESLQNRK